MFIFLAVKSVCVEILKTLLPKQEYKNYAKMLVKKQDGMLTVANVLLKKNQVEMQIPKLSLMTAMIH